VRMPEKVRRPGDPERGVKPYDVWQVRLPQPDGKLKWRIYRTQKEAMRAAREHEDKIQSGVDTTERTVGEVETEMLGAYFGTTTKLRQATVNQATIAAAKIRAEFGDWPLAKVHQRHVEAWRDKLVSAAPARHAADFERLKARLTKTAEDKRAVRARRKLAALEADAGEISGRLARTGPRAANKALAHLRRLFKFAQQRRYCTFNPTDGVHMAKTPRGTDRPIDTNVLTPAEIGAMVAAGPAEHRAALLVLAYAGLRIGELTGLTWGDLELTKRRLRVAQQIESSTGNVTELKTAASRRFVELPGVVVTALREHELRTKKISSEFVFPLHVRRFRDQVFFPALRRAKLRRIRLHDLRHTAASLMIATGADIASVSRQLGHANVSITLGIYTHAFEKRAESGIGSKLDELIRAESGGGFLVVPPNSGAAAVTAGAA
jgi:integrase